MNSVIRTVCNTFIRQGIYKGMRGTGVPVAIVLAVVAAGFEVLSHH